MRDQCGDDADNDGEQGDKHAAYSIGLQASFYCISGHIRDNPEAAVIDMPYADSACQAGQRDKYRVKRGQSGKACHDIHGCDRRYGARAKSDAEYYRQSERNQNDHERGRACASKCLSQFVGKSGCADYGSERPASSCYEKYNAGRGNSLV